MDKDKKIRELEEKEIFKDSYIEALINTVKDMKIGLYAISQMDNIESAIELSKQMLNEFYDSSEFTKLTKLQKEQLATNIKITSTTK
ncbi:MAG: hypothetical protein ACERKV_01190 [Clostridiaceae bacterium]